jgi:hypothetical protein
MALYQHARSLGTAQGEGGHPDSHDQRISAERTARHHGNPFAGQKPNLLQPTRPLRRVTWRANRRHDSRTTDWERI